MKNDTDESGWVKCEERLPTEEGEYTFQIRADLYREGYNQFDNIYIYDIGKNYAKHLKRKFVAWQKLEPYQETNKEDIRDEILENAAMVVFEHPFWGTIRKDYNGKYYVTKNLTDKPKDQLRENDFKSIEEAYAWIMEGIISDSTEEKQAVS